MNIIKKLFWWLSDSSEEIFIEYAPCEGGHHTSYSLIRNARTNYFYPFPKENFQLTTREWQLRTREKMAGQGFYLSL